MWAYPTCFQFVADLSEEYLAALERANPGSTTTDAYGDTIEDSRPAVRQVLDLDRQCPEWFPYMPGFSPKEHEERLQLLQLEQERQRTQAMLADSLARIDADSVKIGASTERTAAILNDTKTFGTRSTILSIGLTVLVLVVSVLALLVAVGVIARKG